MATTKAIHDAAVLHRVALSRYSNTQVQRIISFLNRVDVDVLARLATAHENDRSRLEELLTSIRAIQAAGWARISGVMATDLTLLAAEESTFQHRLIQVAAFQEYGPAFGLSTGQLTGAQVYAAATARPFQGRFLKGWLDDAEEAAARRVREVVRQGFAEGQTIDQMVRAIRGTSAQGYTDGVLAKTRNGVEAMVRTAITHTANVAAQATYADTEAAHPGIVRGWQFVATLDSRTSLICASLDGKIYPIGKGPMPPRHPNCRSTSVVILKGMTPFERELFPAWIKRQPLKVQQEVLGVDKAALFRAGRLTIDKFVDKRGVTLTLDQLRTKYREAFQLAGLAA